MRVKRSPSAREAFSSRVVFLYLFLCSGSAASHALDALFIGAGPEANGYSLRGAAFGANLVFGAELDDNFAAGIKTGNFHDFKTLDVWDFQLLFRYYLFNLIYSPAAGGPFIQAESGGLFIYENGEAFPAFSIGIAMGWNFDLPRGCFLEPTVSFGYPFIWGINLTVGYRFRLREKLPRIEEQKKIKVSNEPAVPAIFMQIPPVYFSPNRTDFEGLGPGIVESNSNTLDILVFVLNTYSDCRVAIEGHANPTSPEDADRLEEEAELYSISEARAQWVLNELLSKGIEPGRLSAAGLGSSKTVAPYNDYANIWQNCRVSFILTRDTLTGGNYEK